MPHLFCVHTQKNKNSHTHRTPPTENLQLLSFEQSRKPWTANEECDFDDFIWSAVREVCVATEIENDFAAENAQPPANHDQKMQAIISMVQAYKKKCGAKAKVSLSKNALKSVLADRTERAIGEKAKFNFGKHYVTFSEFFKITKLEEVCYLVHTCMLSLAFAFELSFSFFLFSFLFPPSFYLLFLSHSHSSLFYPFYVFFNSVNILQKRCEGPNCSIKMITGMRNGRCPKCARDERANKEREMRANMPKTINVKEKASSK